MEPRAHHLLIGVFTLLVAIAAVAFTLWLSKSSKHPQTYYTVEFKEAVRGLSKGSMVQYNGIKVGEVVNLSLSPENPSTIDVRILVDAITPVRADTRARLMVTGLTGQAVVELTGGTSASPPLQANDGQDPVIPSVPSPFSQLFSNGDLLLNNVAALAASGREFLTPENAEAFARVLQNVAVLTDSMAAQTGKLEQLLGNLDKVGQGANHTLQQAGDLLGSARHVLNTQGVDALRSLERTMTSVRQTSDRVGIIAQDNRQALEQGVRGLAELGPMLKELRATLAALRGIARQLDANPTGYLLGREQLQEFEP